MDIKNNGCGNENKTLCWSLVGRNQPYSSRKQIKTHHCQDVWIRKQWGMGSSSGRRERTQTSSLKEAPILRDDTQTCVARQRDCILIDKVQKQIWHPSRLLSRKKTYFVWVLFYFAKNIWSLFICPIYSSNEHLLIFVLLSSVKMFGELLWSEVSCDPCPQGA